MVSLVTRERSMNDIFNAMLVQAVRLTCPSEISSRTTAAGVVLPEYSHASVGQSIRGSLFLHWVALKTSGRENCGAVRIA
jgi:hypothetical protein